MGGHCLPPGSCRRGPPGRSDAALEELPEDGGQIDRFLQGKLHGRAPEEKEKKRLTDALLRRGFPWSEIKSAWSRYGSELPEE